MTSAAPLLPPPALGGGPGSPVALHVGGVGAERVGKRSLPIAGAGIDLHEIRRGPLVRRAEEVEEAGAERRKFHPRDVLAAKVHEGATVAEQPGRRRKLGGDVLVLRV